MPTTSNILNAHSSTNNHIILTPTALAPAYSLSSSSFRPSRTPTPDASAASVRTPCATWRKIKPFHSEKEAEAAAKAEETEIEIEDRNEKSEDLSMYYDQDIGEMYEKEDKLGEGGYGPVFQVVDTQGDMYALKTYWWDKATEDDIDNEIDMFENAGRHNNLVQYFGVVNDPVRRCLRLELCLDRTLNDLLKRRGKLIEEVRYIGTGIAAGLAYLHKEGLIHCDVKTKNILFSPSMVVKVGDLGLSESFKPRMPCTDKVGTPGWIAPEVLKREAHTLAIDVFSFGLMMFKMLEGHQPILTWWEKHEIYPKELEVSMFEVLMSANAKDLVGRLLDFNPSVRPKLNRMNREKFFITGRCPSALNQSIFDEEPNFKAIKRKSSSQSRKEERPKAKHDAASH